MIVRAEDVLVARGLARSFTVGEQHVVAVRSASLRVASGELVAVLGRSGSGKSTLLALCGGLDRPDRGQVLVDGMDVGGLDDEQRQQFLQRTVGWVFQQPMLVPLLTAEENVALAMRIAGEPTAQLDSGMAAEILDLLRDASRTDLAVLFTTHDEAEAAQADRVLVMDDGVLRAQNAH